MIQHIFGDMTQHIFLLHLIKWSDMVGVGNVVVVNGSENGVAANFYDLF